MTDRMGGTEDYLEPGSSFIMEGKLCDEWVSKLVELRSDKSQLRRRRPVVRAWSELFAWPLIAAQYREAYSLALNQIPR